MLLPVEQYGVGGFQRPPGAAMPEEWGDFLLLREMGWSWFDLTGQSGGVPAWFEMCCKEFLRLIAQARKGGNGGK